MAAKPTPGASDGAYGTELNEFLDIGHDADGTHKKSQMLTDMEWVPTTQTGANGSIGEVTFPNGLQMKWGIKSITANTQLAIDFTDEGLADFSNACLHLEATYNTSNTSIPNTCAANSPTVTGFNLINGDVSTRNVNWFAIGR
jgi:hypothetical protein